MTWVCVEVSCHPKIVNRNELDHGRQKFFIWSTGENWKRPLGTGQHSKWSPGKWAVTSLPTRLCATLHMDMQINILFCWSFSSVDQWITVSCKTFESTVYITAVPPMQDNILCVYQFAFACSRQHLRRKSRNECSWHILHSNMIFMVSKWFFDLTLGTCLCEAF